MPDTITSSNGVVGDVSNASRITDAGADSKPADTNSSGTYVSEIINGYEAESPATERIGGDFTGPKRRGRPPGSRNSGGSANTNTTEKAKILLSSFSIEGLLIGIHQMGAAILKTSELEISASEAKQLSDATQAVLKEYNHVINPKTAAWIQLCVALGSVYGTRIVAVQMRNKTERKAKVVVIPSQHREPEPIVPPSPMEREGEL